MNERYLFRGKREDNNEWVTGDLMQWSDGTIRICVESGVDEKTTVTVIPETVGQCTGLKDKNGKMIYEGDIVKGLFNFGLEIMSVCTFENGAFGLTAKQCGAYHFSAFTSLWEVQYEVIGNIHDNPNLCRIEHDSLCETETYKAGDEQ